MALYCESSQETRHENREPRCVQVPTAVLKILVWAAGVKTISIA
jgi:hypothetical protein